MAKRERTETKTLEQLVRELLDYMPDGEIELDTESDMYEEGDEFAPFFTEAFLYNLVGKEAARSILVRVRPIRDLLDQAGELPPEQDEVWP